MPRTHSSIFVFAILVTAACGGAESTPKSPETEPVAANAPADMPPPPATEATAETKPATETPVSGIADPSATSTLSLPTATAKIAMKGKKAANVELKSDGTVTNDGKPVAKVSGMTLRTADGSKSLLAVGSDGAVTTGDGGSYGTFTGDELTMSKGDKLTLADDGTLTMTSAGKAAPLGKFDNASSAKRSAVLAAAFVLAPPVEKSAASAKTGSNKGDKATTPAKAAAAATKPAAPAKK